MATKGSGKGSTPMTLKAAARIQSATAKSGGGGVPKGSFAARAQSVAAQKVTQPQAAKAASTVLTSGSTAKTSKAAAGSALSQVAPKKVTSPAAASAASKVLRDDRTSSASKSAAGSALAQKPVLKKR